MGSKNFQNNLWNFSNGTYCMITYFLISYSFISDYNFCHDDKKIIQNQKMIMSFEI